MLPRMSVALVLAALIAAPAAMAATATTSGKTGATKSVTGPWKPAVPFIEDDFGRALALAKARRLPVFIEGWAPW